MHIVTILVSILYSLDIFFLFLFGIHTFLMVALYRRNKDYCRTDGGVDDAPAIDLDSTPEDSLPEVVIQLPIFNEFYVVDRLLESTTKIKWPKDKLLIQVLDDSTDETVQKVASLVEGFQREGFRMEQIHRVNRAGHKAGALKEGLEKTGAPFIAIFDADFIPDPDFLIKTIPFFRDPEIGMVQTRWGHINASYSPLTRAQSLGIDGHFMIEQVARNGAKLWMNFNGTGGIWRRECIYEAGNWEPDTLTEDFDLSYRAELVGWKFRYLSDVINPAELPATVSAYRSQQFRWCKGSIQTAVKLLPRILKSRFNWKIKGEAAVHLLNYSVHPLMILNILLALPLLVVDIWSPLSLYDIPMLALFISAAFMSLGTFGPIFFYIYSQKILYPDWVKRVRYIPILMVIGTGIAVSNTKAWLEALIGVKSSFKRTPKYRIESQKDRVQERNKYRTPLDRIVYGEIFMGLYCLAVIYLSVLSERFFVIPFMVLYATGFFYIAFESIRERLPGKTVKETGDQSSPSPIHGLTADSTQGEPPHPIASERETATAASGAGSRYINR